MKFVTSLTPVILLAGLTANHSVHAMSAYLKKIPNGDLFNMALGHVNEDTATLSDFAKAFQTVSLTWTPDFCHQTFPGATMTNGEAFGDPCCTWAEGAEPSNEITAFTGVPTNKTTCGAGGEVTPAPSDGTTPVPSETTTTTPSADVTPAPVITDTVAPAITNTPAPVETIAPTEEDEYDDDDSGSTSASTDKDIDSSSGSGWTEPAFPDGGLETSPPYIATTGPEGEPPHGTNCRAKPKHHRWGRHYRTRHLRQHPATL